MIVRMNRITSLMILLMLMIPGASLLSTTPTPSNFIIGEYNFVYSSLYGESDIVVIYNQSLSYTINRFTSSSIELNVSFTKNDVVYVNESIYDDFHIRKYLIVVNPPSTMIFKSIIIIVDDGSNTNVSYLFQLRLIKPCHIPIIFIIFKLSPEKIIDTKYFIEEILIPLMNELLRLDVLNPKCSFTRFTDIDPSYIEHKEKLLLIARYLLLESTLLNSSSNSTNVLYDFLYNGVNDYELAYIGAEIGVELGYKPIIINYVYKNSSYWFTMVDSNIYLSSIDRLFTLQCYSEKGDFREYRILAGTENNLWHWILILSNRVNELRYYNISNGSIVSIDEGICRFDVRRYGWLLMQSLEGINRTLIYYCSQESMEMIGAGCLLVNYAYYKFQKEYLYKPLELDLDEIEKYIDSKASNSLLGKNNFLSMIYPWFFYSLEFNELNTETNQTIHGNVSLESPSIIIAMPVYIYVPLTIFVLVIAYIALLFYYMKFGQKSRLKKVIGEAGIEGEGSKYGEEKAPYLGKTLKIGLREGIIGVFSYVIDALSKYSWKNPWETHREYGERIKELIGESIYRLYRKISVLYERARFSSNEITREDLEEAWNIYNRINNEVEDKGNLEEG